MCTSDCRVCNEWEKEVGFVYFNPWCTCVSVHMLAYTETDKQNAKQQKKPNLLYEIYMRALEIGANGCIFHLLCTLCIFNDKWLGRKLVWGLLEGLAPPLWVCGEPGASASSSCLRHSHPAGADRRSAPPECQTLQSGLWLKELTTPTLTGAAGEGCVYVCMFVCLAHYVHGDELPCQSIPRSRWKAHSVMCQTCCDMDSLKILLS